MQFIKEYNRVLPETLMRKLMDWADRPATDAPWEEGEGGVQSEGGVLQREDTQKFLKFSNTELYTACHDVLSPYFEEYVKDFPAAKGARSYEIKLQKTPISGGFHQWHTEQGDGLSACRAVAWMVYLNDVEDGGETEFLYQGLKVAPTKGTLLIWPASYTHLHRGNPPYSNDKYIITGWGLFDTNK